MSPIIRHCKSVVFHSPSTLRLNLQITTGFHPQIQAKDIPLLSALAVGIQTLKQPLPDTFPDTSSLPTVAKSAEGHK